MINLKNVIYVYLLLKKVTHELFPICFTKAVKRKQSLFWNSTNDVRDFLKLAAMWLANYSIIYKIPDELKVFASFILQKLSE